MFEITDKRVEAAITYLAKTDLECAQLEAKHKAMSELRKSHKGFAFETLVNSGVAATTANAVAYKDKKYLEFIDELERVSVEYFAMKNKRDTERLIVELWRSTNANRKKGNI